MQARFEGRRGSRFFRLARGGGRNSRNSWFRCRFHRLPGCSRSGGSRLGSDRGGLARRSRFGGLGSGDVFLSGHGRCLCGCGLGNDKSRCGKWVSRAHYSVGKIWISNPSRRSGKSGSATSLAISGSRTARFSAGLPAHGPIPGAKTGSPGRSRSRCWPAIHAEGAFRPLPRSLSVRACAPWR